MAISSNFRPVQATNERSILDVETSTKIFNHAFADWQNRPFDKVFKDAFFSESEIRFSNLPKKLFQKTILSLNFEIPTHISKQLVQISSSE